MRSKTGLLISVGLLLCFGLTTIWSTVPNLFWVQIGFLVIGVFIALIFYKLDLSIVLSLSTFIYVFSVFLLVITLFFGQSTRGVTRWIGIGTNQLQTSEIVKPLLVLAYAGFLAKNPLRKIKNLLVYSVLSLIPVLLVKSQPDLGTALVLLVLAGFMGLFAKANLRWIALISFSFLLLIPLAPYFLKDYQINRLESFLSPYHDPKGRGYNAIQSVIAIGSGGLIGQGVSLGTQSHLNFLPERHTDFIFASFAEEFGFLGISLVLIAYFYLLYRLFDISNHLKDTENRLLAIGILSIFLFQSVVNIGMNLGIMPVTGITLPFFSYGGSSLISFAALLGMSLKLLELTPVHQL